MNMKCKPWCRLQYSEITVKNMELFRRNLDIFHANNIEIIKQEMTNGKPTSTGEQINDQLTV